MKEIYRQGGMEFSCEGINMQDILRKIDHAKIIPIVNIETYSDASALGNALMSGGIPLAEVTVRTEESIRCIKTLKAGFSEMLVGGGGVLSVEDVNRAVDAGAEFITTLGFNPRIVDYCIERDIYVIPGINSPTQVEMGLERSLSVFRFFPAEASGGIRMVKALVAAYRDAMFIPVGGVNRQNLLSYIACEGVIACGGSWLLNTELISTGAFEEIIVLVSDAVSMIRSYLPE